MSRTGKERRASTRSWSTPFNRELRTSSTHTKSSSRLAAQALDDSRRGRSWLCPLLGVLPLLLRARVLDLRGVASGAYSRCHLREVKICRTYLRTSAQEGSRRSAQFLYNGNVAPSRSHFSFFPASLLLVPGSCQMSD